MKVFQIFRETFEELPDEPHNSKIVMKERLEKYYAKIADWNRQNLIFKIEPDFDVDDEDILPGEHYALATKNPVTRAKIVDTFNRLESAKEKFRNYKMDNPVDQYAHIEDVINLKGGWKGYGIENEETLLRQKLQALINKKLVLPRSQVPKTKRDKMYDAGQLDDKDITSYYVPPGPNQAKIIKYVVWWKGAKKKLDDELKQLRKQRELQRGRAERYKANQAKGGDLEIAKTSPKLLLAYALKHGPVPEYEDILASDENVGIEYATKVLKGRFPALETAMKGRPESLIKYSILINERVPDIEKEIKAYIARYPTTMGFGGWLKQACAEYQGHFGVDLTK